MTGSTTTIQVDIETKKLLEFIKGWMILNTKEEKVTIGDAVEATAQYFKKKVIERKRKKK